MSEEDKLSELDICHRLITVAEIVEDLNAPKEDRVTCASFLLHFLELRGCENQSPDEKFHYYTLGARLCFFLGKPLPDWIAMPLVKPLIKHNALETLTLDEAFGLGKRTKVRLDDKRRKRRIEYLVSQYIHECEETGMKQPWENMTEITGMSKGYFESIWNQSFQKKFGDKEREVQKQARQKEAASANWLRRSWKK